jgi:hypothetical protein
MRGDQPFRQCRVNKAIEISTNGLTVSEIGLFHYPVKFKTLPLSRKGAKAADKNIPNLKIPSVVYKKTLSVLCALARDRNFLENGGGVDKVDSLLGDWR